MNGDKKTDVMTYTSEGNLLRVAATSKNGRVDQKQWGDLPDGPTWKTILTGDFTGDGRTDAAAGALNGQWTVGVSNGHAFTLAPWGTLPSLGSWIAEMVGDFNGDGKDDIAASSLDTGDWYVLRSTGSSFAVEDWGDWPTGFWRDQLVGDFNGDGKDDIAAKEALATGSWIVELSNGTAFTTSPDWGTFSILETFTDFNAADFNKDGKSDILVRNRSTGKWMVGVSDGSTHFVFSGWANTPAAVWRDVLVGDFTGDGRADVVGRVQDTGRWQLLRSTGSAFVQRQYGAWQRGITWANVIAGPENKDKRMDIIGQHSGGNWWVGISTGTRFDSTDRTERERPSVGVAVRGLVPGGLKVALRVSERADVTVRVSLTPAAARRLHIANRLLGTGVEHFLHGGADPLVVHFRSGVMRRLAGHDFGVIVRATAVDPAANSRTVGVLRTLHG